MIGTFLLKTITWKLSLKIKPMTADGNLFENDIGLLIKTHIRHMCLCGCDMFCAWSSSSSSSRLSHRCKITMDKPQGRFTRNASPIDRMTYTQSHTNQNRGQRIGVKVKEMIVNQQVNTFRTMLIKPFFSLLEYTWGENNKITSKQNHFRWIQMSVHRAHERF